VDQDNNLIREHAQKTARINTDSRPIAYFNNLMIWGQKFGMETGRVFQLLSRIKYQWIIAAIVLISFISSIFIKKLPGLSIFWTLFAAGWAGITVELLILIKYQVEVGMLFYKVGFIITAFMVGLSLGAFLTIQYLRRHRPTYTTLLILTGILILYIPVALTVTKLSFILANFIVALICGMIYQTAAEVMIERGVGRTAGLINGADYMGAAAGSLIASGLIIPLFGFNITLLITAVIVLIAVSTHVIKLF
jgi:spermidine synthase